MSRRPARPPLDGVPIFTVWGISVEVHWSWVIAVAFIYNSFANHYFVQELPGIGIVDRTKLGILAAALYFGSILLHELGHSRQALREGMKVDRITLFVFGGVAWIGEGNARVGPYARVTLAGPAVSLALAIGFGLAASALSALGSSAQILAVLRVMSLVNVVLLLFNLLPVYPLDGGRLLHAALWHLRDDYVAATRWALRTSTVGFFLLIGMGSLSIATGWVPEALLILRPRNVAPMAGFYVGVQFIVLGLLLRRATSIEKGVLEAYETWSTLQGSEEMARARAGRESMKRRRSGSMLVRDMMMSIDLDARPDMTVRGFLDRLARVPGYSTVPFPVVDGDRIIGLMSYGLAAQVPEEQRATLSLREAMLVKEEAVPLSPEMSLRVAFDALQRGGGRGVVLQGEKADETVVAILLVSDVAEALS